MERCVEARHLPLDCDSEAQVQSWVWSGEHWCTDIGLASEYGYFYDLVLSRDRMKGRDARPTSELVMLLLLKARLHHA